MDGQHLQQLYPQATVQSAPCDRANVVCVALTTNSYLWIDTTDLGQRELALLEMLTKTAPEPSPADPWTAFLTGAASPAPQTTAKQLQLLHFQVRFTDDNQHHGQWLTALTGLFDGVLHAAFTSQNAGYLLLNVPISDLSQPDLSSLLDLLDNDFYTNTHIFIGSRQTAVTNLPSIYAFEQQLFHHSHKQAVGTLSRSMLPYLATTHRQALTGVTPDWLADPDNRQLIAALYQTQGNVRQAAANLFLHRNTLLYRIEKLERGSGFNLKNMDDLVYCYLLTLAQPDQT